VKKIAVLTSGGDAPGMNVAIRTIVRTGLHYGMEVYGIYEGYKGLVEGQIEPLSREDLSRIMNRGGTILRSARYPEFEQLDVQKKGIEKLKEKGIEGLVVIGGDGTYKGGLAVHRLGIPTVAIPGTIDNDIPSTDYSIGFFTALETAMDSMDKLRDTSFSHHRCSVVEVMGRHCGDLALYAGIAVGSEFIITPETGFDLNRILTAINDSYNRKKNHEIVIVTEKMTDVNELAKIINQQTKYETRATILGHVQRGGSPTAYDRVLATELAEYAVSLLYNQNGGNVVGQRGMSIVHTPIEDALNLKKEASNKRYGIFGRLKTETEGRHD
jgi:6-phosphofructokinase 1